MAEGNQDQILEQIEQHRRAIADLEARLAPAPHAEWHPGDFYTTFYIVVGMILGIIGGLTSFMFNFVGSALMAQSPMQFLRVLGTYFNGPEALTTTDFAFLMMVLLTHLSVGAVAGAVYHVWVNRYLPEGPLSKVLGSSALFGVGLWLVTFYGIISWTQPMLWGQAYVLDEMPFWVALLTHLVYGLTLGLLQPLGKFVPYRPATGHH